MTKRNKNTQQKCKGKKKQSTEPEKIKNLKNDTQKH